MSQKLYPPEPVKLIVGMLSQRQELFAAAEAAMVEVWGPLETVSEVMDFTYTTYYDKQMGTPLLRKFVGFTEMIAPDAIARIKHQSNELEDLVGGCLIGESLKVDRPINLDPGYITGSKLVLATTKDYSHRIYIGDLMYAETTLHFHQGRWCGWPFTYPDYGSGDYDEFLTAVRQKWFEDIKKV